MKNYLSILLILIVSSCSKIPTPSILSPTENRSIQKVSFGEEPIRYQNILKEYLIANLKNYKTAKVEFINEPTKLNIDHLGDNYSGYRVCLSINEKRGEHYIGYKNHFFLINNNQVNLHLYDSGLLKIPFEYCVSRNMDNEYFIDDIPDKAQDINIESMDSVKLTSKDNLRYEKLKSELEKVKKENEQLKATDEKSIDSLAKIESTKEAYFNKEDIYILCVFDGKDITYVFNSNNVTFKQMDKLDIIPYSVKFNKAYIVANNENLVLTINRVSGKASMENKSLKTGMCKLTNKTKF